MPTKAKTLPPDAFAVLTDHAKRYGVAFSEAERSFIASVKEHARRGVGYGFMRQIVGIEYKASGAPGAIDDEDIARLERHTIVAYLLALYAENHAPGLSEAATLIAHGIANDRYRGGDIDAFLAKATKLMNERKRKRGRRG